ncbi:VENN motif pre-toxin domain-containing protein, partial [Rodentibacter sp. Ppn85]|uniref:VENN motif pre-toxin domain-containing protein n=1 Tax=Rodentibacter sp. Ppn85 TaxID=1908525 RepID=UPI0018E974D7
IAAYDEVKAENQRWQEGGSNRRKVDAAVAVVGAILSGKTAAQTAVAGISPELNAQIHDLTKDNKAANLFSHAVLSATEFYAAGLDPAAGALAGVAGEGVAMVLSEKVFNKPAEQLTTEERNLLKTASQLAGAVVGGISGNSTAATLEGAATAKGAVENNLLARDEDEELFNLSEKFNKNGELKLKEKNRSGELLTKDSYINFLIDLNQKDPNRLTESQKTYLHVELSKIAHSWGVPIEDLYNWDFSNMIKRDDSALTKYIGNDMRFWNSYEGKQAESFAMGVLTTAGAAGIVGMARTLPVATQYAKDIAVFSAKNPVTAEMLVTGGYKAGDIAYKAYDGKYKNEQEFKNDAYDGIKDVIKVPILSKLKPGAQALNSVAFDFMYEVNKPGATDVQVKKEIIGSVAGSGIGWSSEYIPIKGTSKIFWNVIGGNIVGDELKKTYEENMKKSEK